MVREYGRFADLTPIDEAAPCNKTVAFVSYDNGNKYGEDGNAFYIAINDTTTISYKDNEYNINSELPQELKEILESGKDSDDIIVSNGKGLEILSDDNLSYSRPLDYKADMTDKEMYEAIAKCINEYEGEEVVPASYDEYLVVAISHQGFDVDIAQTGDSVSVTCYGKTEEWENKNEAILYYAKGYNGAEGSEQERYSNIVWGLIDGEKNVIDYPDEADLKKAKNSKSFER